MRLKVIVQTVAAQEFDQCRALRPLVGDIGQIDTRRITLVLDVETELLPLHRRSEIVNIFHHQPPVVLEGSAGGVTQRLDEEGLRGIGQVAGELAHLIAHAAQCIFVGHRQHLVGLQTGLQRDVAQRLVHRIFRRIEQTGTRQFLVVQTVLEVRDAHQHRTRLVDVTGGLIRAGQRLVFRIGKVAGDGLALRFPVSVSHDLLLAQVCEGDDVTAVGGGTRLVGDPHLHAVDLHTRGEVRQLRHRLVVVLAEVLRKEEVAVLLVVGDIHLEGGGLYTTLRRDALRRRLLLREHRLQLQFAELHIRPDTKEARCALHQGVVRGERHVTRLNQFNDLVFLAFVFQFQVLGVEVERGVGVVVQVHVQLVAHLAVHAQVDLLVEVEGGGLTVTDGQRGVVDTLQVRADLQFGRSLCLDAHTAGAKDLLGRSQVEVHVGKRELVLARRLHILRVLLAEELTQGPLLRPLRVLLGCHQHRRVQVGVADLRTHIVHVRRVVVLHRLTDIVRPFQVERTRVQVCHLHRCRLLYAPPRALILHRIRWKGRVLK